ncbi:MAG: undecaprenyl/decaprenyl-phosphate alpha-N-acetylglucosaminyl 1-phosphate transferase [Candidatus Gracilibacteria bacterium]|nr:undecaprenyl/decaprenyl-phosphate alpha-N-acetylglucosaminyl 1-phosphate transferase [Candidatus Gracilibacteria bacterium]
MFEYLFLFIISILLGFLVLQIVIKLFYKLKILDNPKKYGKIRDPVPYSTGIVFFITFFILSFIFVEHNYKLYLIWFFGFIITIISFIDDMVNLSPKIRLFIQIIIGITIGATAIKIGYISNIFGGIIDLDNYFIEIFFFKIYIISMIFTVIWYVFIFNAVNWTDGIPGNTSGLSIINFLVLFLLGIILFNRDFGNILLMQNSEFIKTLSVIMIGILIPFWFFDVREKILMGDSGTMFLAFMLASLAIISGGKIATVLIAFGIYTVDAFYVILKRILNKKNPLKGDLTHLHHRLLSLGFSKNKTLIFVYSFSLLFGLIGLFLDKLGKIILFIFIIFFVIFITRVINKFYNYEK